MLARETNSLTESHIRPYPRPMSSPSANYVFFSYYYGFTRKGRGWRRTRA